MLAADVGTDDDDDDDDWVRCGKLQTARICAAFRVRPDPDTIAGLFISTPHATDGPGFLFSLSFFYRKKQKKSFG